MKQLIICLFHQVLCSSTPNICSLESSYNRNANIFINATIKSTETEIYSKNSRFIIHIQKVNKENYRPVSVLTALSKVFEKVSGVQLSSYFESIFSKFLSGFRPTFSCQTILLKMIEDWKQSIDNGKMVGTIAVDLSKAFDSLPHGLLIAKLAAYGVDFYSCRLLASYLKSLSKGKVGQYSERMERCD